MTSEFINKLLDELERRGIRRNTIECILQEGSSLYLENPNDLDFKVIVSYYNPKAETFSPIVIDGTAVECCFYTPRDWNRVCDYKKAYFIVECPDMKCVYGDDSNFKRYDVLHDKNLQKYIINIYDKFLFNVDPNNKKIQPFKKKRLWNFLLFAYRIKNNSLEVTSTQLNTIQNAHDQKVEVESYQVLFEDIKRIVNA